MKKLYGPKPTKRVHPASPPPSPSSLLSSLPAALLALAAALSPHDQETLAYLLGCERPNQVHKQQQQQQRGRPRRQRQQNHPPELGCSCFGCYTSFWARWDSSPNRHVIHLIIDAFEETLELSGSKDRGNKGKGRKKKKKKKNKKDDDEVAIEENNVGNEVGHEQVDDDGDGDDDHDDGDDDEEEEEVEDGEGKSSVRRFVSWVFGMNE